MILIYGMNECSDCRDCKNNFDRFGIEYEFKNITDIKNLRQFLIYRDTNPAVFDKLKEAHDIGIPCLVNEGVVFTDWETYLKELGYTDIIKEGKSCSITHKNC